MEIESVRIIRYDFYRREQSGQVDSSLQQLFESRTELDPQTIDFGGTEIQTRTILYTDLNEDVRHDEFESVQTFLYEDPIPQYFCHTITIGTITNADLEDMGAGDPIRSRTLRQTWVSQLSSITSKIKSSRIHSNGPTPTFLLIEPTQESLSDQQSGKFSIHDSTAVTDLFRDNADTLAPYGFKPTEQISSIDDTYLTTHSTDSANKMPLSILAVREQGEPKSDEIIEYWRSWIGFAYGRMKSITSILLILHWLTWRREEISVIDNDLYEYNLTKSHTDELREEEQELEQLRRKWVESHSDTADEFQEMKQLVEYYDMGNNDTIFDNPIGQETTNSYLYQHLTLLQTEFDKLDETIERVETKLGRFISVVQDRIQSNTTESNLQLQSTVKNLTILLAVIAILNFFITLRDDILKHIPEVFMQSGVAVAGMIILVVGFVLGYTHT